MSVLEIDDLKVAFRTASGPVRVLHGVSLAIQPGEAIALLGESGSGKSVTASAVMDLLPRDIGMVEEGGIRFEGTDLRTLSDKDRRAFCGQRMSLVFQDALAALNPVYPIGWQVAEMFTIHDRGMSRQERQARAVELLASVGIPDAERRARSYPHQFSGGMRQRVAIAMALALRPSLIIADEPTTALDVTVQAQILDLLQRLRQETGAALIIITHDLGVVAEIADRVAVMYAGRIVEDAPVDDLFHRPLHPYTEGLLASQPVLDGGEGVLTAIPGAAPNPALLPSGCPFHPRCRRATDLCLLTDPPLVPTRDGRRVACHHPGTLS